MPTHRPLHEMPALVLAAQAAEDLDAQLIIIRSGKAIKQPFPDLLAPRGTHRTAVIDLASDLAGIFPSLQSDSSLISRLHRKNDVALKRNLAQLLAVLCGWDLLLVLDDDMRSSAVGEPSPGSGANDLRATDVVAEFVASRELQAVGYTATEFPDHSVLGHIERGLGRRAEVFLGGSLWTRVGTEMPFYSRAYNEDWIWVLAHLLGAEPGRRQTTVMSAGSLFQSPYDPLRRSRARSEELGDVLAEGLFRILAEQPGGAARAAACDAARWEEFVHQRRLALSKALLGVTDCYRQQREFGRSDRDTLALEAMTAAFGVYGQRTTREWGIAFASFVASWLGDLQVWRQFLISRSSGSPMELPAALASLDLASSTSWVHGGRDGLRLVMGGLAG
jgi:hypothetical protein